MRYRNPGFFLLLLPVAVALLKAWWDMTARKRTPRVAVSWKRLWGNGAGTLSVPPRFWHAAGYALACVFFVFAAARPQTSYQKIKRNVEGIDIMVVLDLSASMRIEDFRDRNRMEIAKIILKEFITGRPNDRIGFQTFSGEAVTLVPPTLDHQIVQQALKDSNIGDLKDGTAIGDALATAVGRLKESTARSRIVVLLTDGDSNIGAVDPLTAGELAKGFGIKIYSVAIGRDGRVAMPFIAKDVFGRQVKTYQYFDSSINPELPRQISNMSNGKFFRVQNDEKILRDAFKEIDQLERNTIEMSEQVKYEEHFMVFAQIGLFLLAVTFLLQHTALRVYP